MKFELTDKDYQREYYEAHFEWEGIPLRAYVHMRYHTFLKYWSVYYYIGYGTNYGTPHIKFKDYLEGPTGRKDARKLAEQWMKEADPSDVDKLEKFYQGQIRTSTSKSL